MQLRLIKIGLAMLLPLLLTACDILPAPGPDCVAAQEIGDITTKSFVIRSAVSTWTNTGIVVTSGDRLNVDITSGSLLLCGQEDIDVSVNATNGNWTDTGINVYSKDWLIVEVPDPTDGSLANPTAATTQPTTNAPSWQKYRYGQVGSPAQICLGGTDTGCWHTNGYALMGKLDNNANTGWGDLGAATIPVPWDNGSRYGFRYYNGAVLHMENYFGTGTAPLRLYLMLMDSNGSYGNNAGGYVPKVRRLGCMKYNGQNAEIKISGSGITQSLVGGGWNGTAWANGSVYVHITDTLATGGDGNYANNFGDYSGNISIYDMPHAVSDAINFIIEGETYTRVVDGMSHEYRYGGVKPKLEKAREIMYRAIITTGFHRIVTGMLTLYIAIYGVLFIYGFIEHTQTDFIIRVVKIAIILQLVQPGSWDFFNTYLFPIFAEGAPYVVHVFSTAHLGAVPPYNPDMGVSFSFLDTTLSMFFSQSTWIKISAVLFSGPLGWIVVLLMMLGMWFYLMGVVMAFILYLIAIVALSLLIAMAPIFLVFMLFEKTKKMFDAWINAMFAYALRPAMVFAVLVIFNFFIYAIMIRIFSFEACWGCICRLPPMLLGLCIFVFYKPVMNSSNCGDFFTNLPVGIIDVAMLIIVARMTGTFISYAETMAAQIANVSQATNLGGMAKDVRKDMATATKTIAMAVASGGAGLAKAGAGMAAKGGAGLAAKGGAGAGKLAARGGATSGSSSTWVSAKPSQMGSGSSSAKGGDATGGGATARTEGARPQIGGHRTSAPASAPDKASPPADEKRTMKDSAKRTVAPVINAGLDAAHSVSKAVDTVKTAVSKGVESAERSIVKNILGVDSSSKKEKDKKDTDKEGS